VLEICNSKITQVEFIFNPLEIWVIYTQLVNNLYSTLLSLIILTFYVLPKSLPIFFYPVPNINMFNVFILLYIVCRRRSRRHSCTYIIWQNMSTIYMVYMYIHYKNPNARFYICSKLLYTRAVFHVIFSRLNKIL